MPEFRIEDPADPRLADYADLIGDADRPDAAAARRGVFIAEGELVVRHLLASRFVTRSVLVTPQRLPRLADALAGRDIPVYVADERVMQAIVGFEFHRGVLAAGERPAAADTAALIADATTILVLEGLSNADNVGAIFRNAAGLGGPRPMVLLTDDCCDPLYRKAVRVSMGHALRLPFARVTAVPTAALRDAGFTLIALTPDPAARDIRTIAPGEFSKPALLLGAEGAGLTPGAMSAANVRMRIPMTAGADSLNVATAAAVALSHLIRGTIPRR